MRHSIRILQDKTLVITLPQGMEVDRVLVEHTGMQTGTLYYQERKGEWVERTGLYEIGHKCSECKKIMIIIKDLKFCPYCGARMVGDAE